MGKRRFTSLSFSPSRLLACLWEFMIKSYDLRLYDDAAPRHGIESGNNSQKVENGSNFLINILLRNIFLKWRILVPELCPGFQIQDVPDVWSLIKQTIGFVYSYHGLDVLGEYCATKAKLLLNACFQSLTAWTHMPFWATVQLPFVATF